MRMIGLWIFFGSLTLNLVSIGSIAFIWKNGTVTNLAKDYGNCKIEQVVNNLTKD